MEGCRIPLGRGTRIGPNRAKSTAIEKLAAEPVINFLDEPTTGSDSIVADIISDQIVNSVCDLGTTTLSVTHSIADAGKSAKRFTALWEGWIIWSGSKAETDRTDNMFADQFVHVRATGPVQMAVYAP